VVLLRGGEIPLRGSWRRFHQSSFYSHGRRLVDVFVDQGPAKIRPRRMQRDLAGLFAFGKPGSLDMGDVIEEKPGDREHPQVDRGSCSRSIFFSSAVFAGLKLQG